MANSLRHQDRAAPARAVAANSAAPARAMAAVAAVCTPGTKKPPPSLPLSAPGSPSTPTSARRSLTYLRPFRRLQHPLQRPRPFLSLLSTRQILFPPLWIFDSYVSLIQNKIFFGTICRILNSTNLAVTPGTLAVSYPLICTVVLKVWYLQKSSQKEPQQVPREGKRSARKYQFGSYLDKR